MRDRLRPAANAVVQVPEEVAPRTPAAPPAPTFEQRLSEQLAQAEAALQRGELASPPGNNAVELFRGALELDPGNSLAKAGLIRVADRLLSAAERAITAGSVEDARKMVAVAESLTPATARGAFLMMQIEREHERTALTRAKDTDAQDKLEKGATYLRLAKARLASGALIEPSEDNARYYVEAARQIIPEDAAVQETSRLLQKAAPEPCGDCRIRRQCRRHRTLAGECRQRRRAAPGNDCHPARAAGHPDRRARRPDEFAHAVVCGRTGCESPGAARQ